MKLILYKFIFLTLLIILNNCSYKFNNILENGPIIEKIYFNKEENKISHIKENFLYIYGDNIYKYKFTFSNEVDLENSSWKDYKTKTTIENIDGSYEILLKFIDKNNVETKIYKVSYLIDLFPTHNATKIANFNFTNLNYFKDDSFFIYSYDNNIFRFSFDTNIGKQLTFDNKSESAYFGNSYENIYCINGKTYINYDYNNITAEANINYIGSMLTYLTQIYKVNDYYYYNLPTTFIDIEPGLYRSDKVFNNQELLIEGHCQNFKFRDSYKKILYTKSKVPYIYNIDTKIIESLDINCINFDILNSSEIIYESNIDDENGIYIYNINSKTKEIYIKDSYNLNLSNDKKFFIFQTDRVDQKGIYKITF